MSLASNRGSIEERALMLAAVRNFFSLRNVLEVDTPILSLFAPIDTHIEVMEVSMGHGKTGYLHTSPEYGIKKLLSSFPRDLYQLGHVFRAEEEGPLHSPEFTMLEWYRVGMSLEKLIEETCELISLFFKPESIESLTYQEAFLKLASIDPFEGDLSAHTLLFSPSAHSWDRDTQLNLLFSHLVEPKMKKGALTVVHHFPASQAALAQTVTIEGIEVARRFEIYFEGIELANGSSELTDPIEQKRRLLKENAKREQSGKDSLPIDYEFLKALETMPQCAGVAVGFDRLMKLYSLHP